MQKLLLIGIVATLLGGCTLFDSTTPFDEVYDLFPVQLGDSPDQVRAKMGAPGYSWMGDCLCWGYEYVAGPYAKMRLTFPEIPGEDEPLMGISVEAPYNGSSRHGLRIGATRNVVRQMLGTPDAKPDGAPSDTGWDRFSYDSRSISIDYDTNNRVTRISIGEKAADR
ncbi:MAG: hypothetical protein KDD65_14250 [Bacteroidetes bacterium]|nr:hypothetical protein [Bacteroidota bacterium]